MSTEMDGVVVENIMADGTVCEDLSTYWDTHELPELTIYLLQKMMTREPKNKD